MTPVGEVHVMNGRTRITVPVYRFALNEMVAGGLHGVKFVRLSDLQRVLPDLEIVGPVWGPSPTGSIQILDSSYSTHSIDVDLKSP